MRRVVSFLAFLGFLFLAAPGFAAFDEAQKADLKRVSEYLNSIGIPSQ